MVSILVRSGWGVRIVKHCIKRIAAMLSPVSLLQAWDHRWPTFVQQHGTLD